MVRANGSSKKRQQEISGTEAPDDVAAIDDAMADYLNDRQVLLGMRKKVDASKAGVLVLMRQYKRKRYVYRDGVYRFVFTADDKSELHVKREHEKKDEETRPKRARRSAAGADVGVES